MGNSQVKTPIEAADFLRIRSLFWLYFFSTTMMMMMMMKGIGTKVECRCNDCRNAFTIVSTTDLRASQIPLIRGRTKDKWNASKRSSSYLYLCNMHIINRKEIWESCIFASDFRWDAGGKPLEDLIFQPIWFGILLKRKKCLLFRRCTLVKCIFFSLIANPQSGSSYSCKGTGIECTVLLFAFAGIFPICCMGDVKCSLAVLSD